MRVDYAAVRGVTWLSGLREDGAFRLRHRRSPPGEAMLVNTGGGMVGGDQLEMAVALGPGASASLTSVAAEKIYRSSGASTTITNRIVLDDHASYVWAPQETILFDGIDLVRRFEIDMAPGARLMAVESIVFGRLAYGETAIAGRLRDSWRLRRDGRLVFADETRIDGAIGDALDRPGVAAGARAIAMALIAAPDAEHHLDPIRGALTGVALHQGCEGAASFRDGIILARLISASPQALRCAILAVLACVEGASAPRGWL